MKNEADQKRLYERILLQIGEGSLKMGDRLASERRLADEYGTTVRAVKNALQRLEDAGVLSREQGRGTFVKRVPKELIAKKVGLVHLTNAWVERNLMFSELYHNCVRVLRAKGQSITYFPLSAEDAQVKQDIISAQCDGLILLNIPERDFIEELVGLGKKLVSVYYYPEFDASRFDGFAVYQEHYSSMVSTVRRLKELGHTRIGFLGGWEEYPTREMQMNRLFTFAAFKAALGINGMAYDERYSLLLGNEIKDSDAPVARILNLEKRPTAVFTDGPNHLQPLLRVAGEMGLKIPEELSLITVGWPTDEYSGIYAHPGEMVNAAVHLLDSQMSGHEAVGRLVGIPKRLNHEQTIAPPAH